MRLLHRPPMQQVRNHLELIEPNSMDNPEKQKKDEQFASAALGEDAVLVGGVQQDERFMGSAQHRGKMRALENLSGAWLARGDKVLLFGYFVKMLDILDRFMVRKDYRFCGLGGSTPMGLRQNLMDNAKRTFLLDINSD